MSRQRKIALTFGNLFILIGVYLLLFVGGLFADQQYNVYAASGGSPIDLPTPTRSVPTPTAAAQAANGTVTPSAAPAGTSTATAVPSIETISAPNVDNQLSNAVPAATGDFGPSTLSRIVIPAIAVDRKVVEMGWTVQVQDGQEVAVWDVDKYRVGHHKGTANPGQGGNIVLSGHSGGWQYPFNDIFYLKQGDLIQLTSNGTVYDYKVSDHILVDEVGQPLEKRLENAKYIEPTDEEMITMVACWPLTGPDKFKQRIIIRAKPVGNAASGAQTP